MSTRTSSLDIVVGVDESSSSQKAVRWAAREARMRNVPLVLVHVKVIPDWGPAWLFADPMPAAPIETSSALEKSHEKIIAGAIKAIEESSQDGDLPEIKSELVLSAPVPALVEVSEKAQMVVVGCRSQNALRRILLGSVSSGLIHHARCPVAVIHDESSVALDGSKLPVVVGVDGSPASELATAIAFDEASWRGVDLVALHAWRDPDLSTVPSMEWSAQEARCNEILGERLAGWRERYPDVRVHPRVVWGDPARSLLDESDSAQLVVVGSHGRGGFAGMLLGSVSTAVTHAAQVPVIVAR